MPQPHLRTRSRKRLNVKLPGGENRLHYRASGISPLLCTICDKPLAGIPHGAQKEMRKLNRSKKRIWRPYGGQICHNCLKNALKQAVRSL